AGGTTVSVDDPTEWELGDIMDFPGSDSSGSYEQMRVYEDDITANPIDVQTGWNDTTNQNHSDNSVVLKNPRHGTDQITKAITRVIEAKLWPDMWVVSTSTVTPGNPQTTYIYDLPSDFEDFVQLTQVATGSIEDLVYVRAAELWHVPTAVSATNTALRVTSWPRLDVDGTLFYRTRVTTSNMTGDMETVIALGAAADLMRMEAIEKVDRPDEDDRAGRLLRAAREMEAAFHDERRRHKMQLMRQWGQVRRFRRGG
ncbi:MAG: hypothetical protein L0Z49_05290, partial [Actinobacteria bacterium]|nr:hypothetical protein [Actinomycetota bacterium]